MTGNSEGGANVFPQAEAVRGECFTEERFCLQFRRVTEHMGSGGCVLSSLFRATNPNLSSHDSSSLFLPFTRAQGEWLQRRFCALTF